MNILMSEIKNAINNGDLPRGYNAYLSVARINREDNLWNKKTSVLRIEMPSGDSMADIKEYFKRLTGRYPRPDEITDETVAPKPPEDILAYSNCTYSGNIKDIIEATGLNKHTYIGGAFDIDGDLVIKVPGIGYEARGIATKLEPPVKQYRVTEENTVIRQYTVDAVSEEDAKAQVEREEILLIDSEDHVDHHITNVERA